VRDAGEAATFFGGQGEILGMIDEIRGLLWGLRRASTKGYFLHTLGRTGGEQKDESKRSERKRENENGET